jgi:hypothetical protein
LKEEKNMTAKVDSKGPSELLVAKRAWLDGKKAVAELDARLETMEEKKLQRLNDMEKADEVLSGSADEMRIALSSLALDEITEGDFAAIRNVHEKARQSKADLSEMLKAIEEEKGILGNKRAELAREAKELEGRFWLNVMELLKAKALQHEDLMYKTFLAYRRAGSGHLNFGDFMSERLFTKVKNLFNNENAVRMSEELEKEFTE